jgi:hypothetical protein
MYFVDLKPAPYNKDLFNVEYIQQCKIEFEPPQHERDISQCANEPVLSNRHTNWDDFRSLVNESKQNKLLGS